MVCEEVSWGSELMAPWMVSKSASQLFDETTMVLLSQPSRGLAVGY